jgi:hypothetical protein
MRIRRIAFLVITVCFATVAWSGEDAGHHMAIAVVGADGDSGVRIDLDSDEMDFNLHDMQVGENRAIVDKSGRSILVTRGENNFTFDVDGKTIEMPLFNAHDDAHVWVGDGDFTTDVDVRVLHEEMGGAHGMAAMAGTDGVMIISGKEIDEATQQIIRTALESAGHEGVRFGDGHEGGPHQIRVVEKIVEVH